VPVTLQAVTVWARSCWTQSMPVPVTVERSHCLYPFLLNTVTACTRSCWTQSLPVPVPVEHSHCLYPFLLNTVTAYTRSCWTQSLPMPIAQDTLHEDLIHLWLYRPGFFLEEGTFKNRLYRKSKHAFHIRRFWRDNYEMTRQFNKNTSTVVLQRNITLEDGTDCLSRNVGKELPILAT